MNPPAPRRDRHLLYAGAFLRGLAVGMTGVLLGLYLARLGHGPWEVGWVVAAGLIGATLAALAVSLAGDRLGRRRALLVLALLSAAGGFGAAFASGFAALALCAFFGMLNGMGRDRGAALILDQAILPATASDRGRTRVFAVYNVLLDVGHALGGLLAALPSLLTVWGGASEVAAQRAALSLYGILFLAAALLYAFLSPGTEAPRRAEPLALSHQSRRVLWRLCGLFGLDSVAGGFLTSSLLTYFFFTRFGVGEAALGVLFFSARILNALSHLGAAWLARRIGLVNTMVFTHIPSSLLLASVGFAPNFPVAALLFLLREGLVEMDVPTRQSYVMAVVRPEERTFASGVTHLVRVGGWAAAPGFAGMLMGGLSLAAPLYIGSAMKIGYDLLLYAAFRKLKPPEEQGG